MNPDIRWLAAMRWQPGHTLTWYHQNGKADRPVPDGFNKKWTLAILVDPQQFPLSGAVKSPPYFDPIDVFVACFFDFIVEVKPT